MTTEDQGAVRPDQPSHAGHPDPSAIGALADGTAPGRDATSARAAVAEREPILRARRLVKTFGRVVGLDGVSLDLYPGEVLAIIGDNGAGKSTMIKCLTGALVPDAGELMLENEPVTFRRPQDARAAGIETVYQTLAVARAS